MRLRSAMISVGALLLLAGTTAWSLPRARGRVTVLAREATPREVPAEPAAAAPPARLAPGVLDAAATSISRGKITTTPVDARFALDAELPAGFTLTLPRASVRRTGATIHAIFDPDPVHIELGWTAIAGETYVFACAIEPPKDNATFDVALIELGPAPSVVASAAVAAPAATMTFAYAATKSGAVKAKITSAWTDVRFVECEMAGITL